MLFQDFLFTQRATFAPGGPNKGWQCCVRESQQYIVPGVHIGLERHDIFFGKYYEEVLPTQIKELAV